MLQLQIVPNALKNLINGQFSNKEPWQIVSITSMSVLAAVWLWGFVSQPESYKNRAKKAVFRLARNVPFIRKRIEDELQKIADTFEKEALSRTNEVPYITTLGLKGMSQEEIMALIQKYLNLGHYKWKEGFVSGAVYYHSEDLIKLLTAVYGLASYTNPLHADIFPGINKMEAEVVRMATSLFHGGSESCGTMTTGGTESILMACKAYRDYAKEEKGIIHPEMVIPQTAHPAFEKAAQYLGIRICYVSLDSDYCVSVPRVKSAISGNTIMLVGSAPNYPYGTMDDIESLAALGRRYNIPVHVDCCLGGFLTAFMPAAGFPIPQFDFKVPGVTSISADTHKYGFAPKGSSLVLYSEPKYRHSQYCVTTDWPGGIYGSPTVNGSRAGGVIAACWATLMYFGMDGYVSATKKIINTTKYIENELRKVDGIFIFGKPVTSVIAIGSDVFQAFRLAEKLNANGWNVNPLQFPQGLHLCITYLHTQDGVADRFIQDVRTAVEELLKDPKKVLDGKMAMYGMSLSIPDRSIVGDFTKYYIDSMYYTPKQAQQSLSLNGVNK